MTQDRVMRITVDPTGRLIAVTRDGWIYVRDIDHHALPQPNGRPVYHWTEIKGPSFEE